jgi:hypothetical protein
MSSDNRMIAENFNKSALNQTNITCNSRTVLHPRMCYDASFVVFVVLKLLEDLLDFQEFVFYWVCQVFLVYFRIVIQIVYGLLVLRRLDCLLLWGHVCILFSENENNKKQILLSLSWACARCNGRVIELS